MTGNFIAWTFAKSTGKRYANGRRIWLSAMVFFSSLAVPLRADFIQQIQISDAIGFTPEFSADLGPGFASPIIQQPDLLQLNGDLITLSLGAETPAVEILGSPGGSAVAFLSLNLNPVDCSNADETGHCDQFFTLIFEDIGSATFSTDLNALGALPSVVATSGFRELDQLLNTYGPSQNGSDIFSIQVSGPTPEPGTLALIACAGLFIGIQRLVKRTASPRV